MEYNEIMNIFRVGPYGEGGIDNALDHAKMKDAPALAIGLGGFGVEALAHLQSAARELFGSPLPPQLALLAVDAEPYEACRQAFEDVGADPDGCGYVHLEYVRSEGRNDTGGNRSLGARALEAAAVEFEGKAVQSVLRLCQTHCDLHGGRPTELNVYLLAGLGGGVGSLAADVAEMLRFYVGRKMPELRLNVQALLFTPPVYETRIRQFHMQRAACANAWAAMQEIDRWMDMGTEAAPERRYERQIRYDRICTQQRPFDFCFFCSANPGAQEPAHDCLESVAWAVALQLVEAVEEIPFDGVGVESPMPDAIALTELRDAALPAPAQRKYGLIGAADRRVPLNQIGFLLGKQALDALQEREPDEAAARDFLRARLRADADGILEDVQSALRAENQDLFFELEKCMQRYEYRSVGRDALAGDMIVRDGEQWVRMAAARCEQICRSRGDFFRTHLEEELGALFVDPQFGPRYADTMARLAGKRLDEQCRQLDEHIRRETESMHQLLEEINARRERARGILLPFMRDRYTEFVESCREYVGALLRRETSVRILGLLQECLHGLVRVADGRSLLGEKIRAAEALRDALNAGVERLQRQAASYPFDVPFHVIGNTRLPAGAAPQLCGELLRCVWRADSPQQLRREVSDRLQQLFPQMYETDAEEHLRLVLNNGAPVSPAQAEGHLLDAPYTRSRMQSCTGWRGDPAYRIERAFCPQTAHTTLVAAAGYLKNDGEKQCRMVHAVHRRSGVSWLRMEFGYSLADYEGFDYCRECYAERQNGHDLTVFMPD